MYGLLLLWVLAGGLPAQTVREALTGVWTGTGRLNGLEAQATQTWSSELGGRFRKLTYRVTLQLKEGRTARFEGDAYYPGRSACPCIGTWFDSNGEVYELRGEESEGKLVSEWGRRGESVGRTEYRLSGRDQLEVTDWVKTKDGNWREFANISYRRKVD